MHHIYISNIFKNSYISFREQVAIFSGFLAENQKTISTSTCTVNGYTLKIQSIHNVSHNSINYLNVLITN
jgi:hypothetical protein